MPTEGEVSVAQESEIVKKAVQKIMAVETSSKGASQPPVRVLCGYSELSKDEFEAALALAMVASNICNQTWYVFTAQGGRRGDVLAMKGGHGICMEIPCEAMPASCNALFRNRDPVA